MSTMSNEDILEAVDMLISRSTENGCINWSFDLKSGVISCTLTQPTSDTSPADHDEAVKAVKEMSAQFIELRKQHTGELIQKVRLVHDLTQQLESSREEASIYEKQMRDAIGDCNRQLQEAAAIRAQLEQELLNLREDVRRQECLSGPDRQLEEAAVIRAQLEQELLNLREDNRRRQECVSSLEQSLEEAAAIRAQLEQELLNLREDNRRRQECVSSLEQSLEEAAAVRAQLEQELSARLSQVETREEENATSEQSESNARLIALTEELEATLAADQAKSQQDRMRLQEQLDAAIADRQHLNNRIREYEEITKHKVETLEANLEAACAAKSSLLQQIENLKLDNQTIVDDLNSRLYQMVQERDDFASHNEDDAETVASLQETVASLNDSIASLQDEISEFERTVKEKSEEYETLKRSYDEMMQSSLVVKEDRITKEGAWKGRPRCYGTAKTGDQCGRSVAEVGEYCHQHLSQKEEGRVSARPRR